jgi:hypothetical protein
VHEIERGVFHSRDDPLVTLNLKEEKFFGNQSLRLSLTCDQHDERVHRLFPLDWQFARNIMLSIRDKKVALELDVSKQNESKIS